LEYFTDLGDSLGFRKVKPHEFLAIHDNSKRAKPVPLTEEILLKCPQFRNEYCDKNSGDESYYFEARINNDKYHDLALLSGDKNGYFDVYLFPYENQRVKYLHQLQNLYFTLTGEELEVKWN